MAKSLNRHVIKATYDVSTFKTATSPSTSQTTYTSPISNVVYIPNHNFESGDTVGVISGTVTTGLTLGNQYWIYRYDQNNIGFASSFSNATAATPTLISLSGTTTSLKLIQNTIGTISVGPKIPIGAIVVAAWGFCRTAITASTGTPTVQIGIDATANNLLASTNATALGQSTSGTASRFGFLPGSFIIGANTTSVNLTTAALYAAAVVGSYVVTTKNDAVTFTIGSAAVSAGAFDVYLEYISRGVYTFRLKAISTYKINYIQ